MKKCLSANGLSVLSKLGRLVILDLGGAREFKGDGFKALQPLRSLRVRCFLISFQPPHNMPHMPPLQKFTKKDASGSGCKLSKSADEPSWQNGHAWQQRLVSNNQMVRKL